MDTSKKLQIEIVNLREAMRMNRREFSDYYEIPYRTVQDWEAGKRTMPEYVLRLMKYKAEAEKMCGLQNNGKAEDTTDETSTNDNV